MIRKIFSALNIIILFIILTAQTPKTDNKDAAVLKKNDQETTAEKRPPSTSLMFTDSELKDVDRALDSYNNNKLFVVNNGPGEEKKEVKTEDNVKSFIYLNSILYFSPESWSVWINDKKISSITNKHGSEFYVKSVNDHQASILWTISISKWKILSGRKSEEGANINKNNQVEVSFTLKPNQTFMLVSGDVVEGRP